MKRMADHKHNRPLTAGIVLLLGALNLASAQADTTGYLSPTTEGFYQAWIRSNDVTEVNDFIGCDPSDLDDTSWAYSNSEPEDARASAVISLAGVPDGATIDSVDIQVCQTRGVLGGDDAIFQTFARVDGADADSGVDIPTNNDPDTFVPNTQNIAIGIVKGGGTTLEVGVRKIGTDNAARVFSLAAQINFTPAGGPVTPPTVSSEPIPVFGPIGLLLTTIGVGLLGMRQARRKS